jgi:L-fucose isomerase-like protein
MTQTIPLLIGFMALARTTFDQELAAQMAHRVRLRLQTAATVVGPQSLVIDKTAVVEAWCEMSDKPLDLLVVLQATFTDSTMLAALAEAVDVPLLIWAVPEARTGGRLRLNSFCGLNLAAHALTRAGYKYDYMYADPEATAALEKVQTIARAGRVRRLLRGARVGRIGEHPAGFETCDYDAEALKRRFGVEVMPIDLTQQIFDQARAVEPTAVAAAAEDLRTRLNGLEQLEPTASRKTLSTYVALRKFADQESLSGLAVRCWPEFFTDLGCAACGCMSLLSDEMLPCSCEADVNGTITQLILQWLSGEPAFGSDLVAFDAEENIAVLWHCGLAPLSMADPAVPPLAVNHPVRKLPLVMEFPLKPGVVTLARLSQANDQYRLVVGRGEMLQAPKSFSGTSGVLRFERPALDVLETIVSEGLEHHISLTYGDHVEPLLALARIFELPVLRL